MSSYMVSNENLSRMAGYLGEILDAQMRKRMGGGPEAYYLNKEVLETFKAIPGLYDPEYQEFKVKVLHRALYDMNRDALIARYGECNDAYEHFDGKRSETREETRDEWQCRLFSILRNYLYQCSEGNVPETKLFKAVSSICNTIAYTIAEETAKRDWGCGWSDWKPNKGGERESKMRDSVKKPTKEKRVLDVSPLVCGAVGVAVGAAIASR